MPLGRIGEEFRTLFPLEFLASGRDGRSKAGKERMDSEGGTVNESETPTATLVGHEPQGKTVEVDIDDVRTEVGAGSVVIAAITSCTNTSNPSVMVGAALRCEESGRTWADGQTLREDEPGPGLTRGH